MPCTALAEHLLARSERGTRWPELVDRLFSTLLGLEPPLLPRRRDRVYVEELRRLIDEDRLPDALALAARLGREWGARRLSEGVGLGAVFLALLVLTGFAALTGYLVNRGLC